jgi:preprotein translocase subunit YajC
VPEPLAPLLWLAADPAPATPPGGGGGEGVGGIFAGPLPLFVLIFFIIWFVVIRPQSKDRKKREAELRAVKKYDEVITNAGIHAKVVGVDDTTVELRIDDKNDVRITVEKSALWQIKRIEDETPAKDQAADGKAKAEKGKA